MVIGDDSTSSSEMNFVHAASNKQQEGGRVVDGLLSLLESTLVEDTTFQTKRCQPFLMIPLERWNVERSGTSWR
jgi:hypothetical protein